MSSQSFQNSSNFLDPTAENGHQAPVVPQDDAFTVGFEYLTQVRRLALSADMIETADGIGDRIRICTWIGNNIRAVNLLLNVYLYACHQCFEAVNRPQIRVLAAPLASKLGIDGLCNLLRSPTVILVDVGRVAPLDWLGIVAHEYAHAYLRTPGHDQRFLEAINHLCLGLGLPQLLGTLEMSTQELERRLRTWPVCEMRSDSLAFWRGEYPLDALRERRLFADAEAAEDLIQHRFGDLLARDLA